MEFKGIIKENPKINEIIKDKNGKKGYSKFYDAKNFINKEHFEEETKIILKEMEAH